MWGAGGSEQGCRGQSTVVTHHPAACQLPPPAPTGPPRPRGRGVGRPGWEGPGWLGTGVREAAAGRWPFQSQADVWGERGRQTVSPCSHLGLGWGPPELGPRHGRPPTAAPIRFLPIKQPVFLLAGPCRRWSLGKRGGGGGRGRAPLRTGHDVDRMCAPCRAACAHRAGTGEAGRPLGVRGSESQHHN